MLFLQKNSSKNIYEGNCRVRFQIGNSCSQKRFALNFSVHTFVIFIKYEKSGDENEWETEPRGSTPPGGVGPLLAAPPCGVSASKLIFVPVSSCDFVLMFNFRLYNPPDYPRSVYRVLVVFLFRPDLSGVVLSFRGIMASASNDKEKMPSEDNHQDPKLKEEVESEAEEEEIEEE
jgi:hypothetical protein